MTFSLTDLGIQYLLRAGIISLATHEYAHMKAADMLGIYAEIRNTKLNSVFPQIRKSLGRDLFWHEHVFLYGAGGWIQCLIFLILNIHNKDSENRLANKMIAIEGFIYGCFEALAPRLFWESGALLGILAGSFLLIWFILWKKPELIP